MSNFYFFCKAGGVRVNDGGSMMKVLNISFLLSLQSSSAKETIFRDRNNDDNKVLKHNQTILNMKLISRE